MRQRYDDFRLLLILSCLALAVPVRAQIQLTKDLPVVGEKVTITLEEPTSRVEIIYRPNSAVIRRDTLRADQPQTTFEWVPEKAGVVALKAGDARRNVSVKFEGVSYRGIAVMLLAGLILFGGVIFAFRLLFRKEEIDIDVEHRPDT